MGAQIHNSSVKTLGRGLSAAGDIFFLITVRLFFNENTLAYIAAKKGNRTPAPATKGRNTIRGSGIGYFDRFL